jgi:type I restriction enzyme S subunit
VTPEQFVKCFGVVAEAPNGITALRSLVLALAVRGRLTERLSTDRHPSELLMASALGAPEHLEETVRNDGFPARFSLPEGWLWTQLSSISVYIQRGKSPKYDDASSIPLVSQKCIQWRGFSLQHARSVSEATIEQYKQERFLQPGDLLWNSTGTGTVGRVNVMPDLRDRHERIVTDSHVTVIRLWKALPEYVWCWLASSVVQMSISHLTTGSTNQKELGTATVRACPVPLPSIAEQHRIVAKVDQLMALLDDLEQRREKKQTVAIQVSKTSLDSLVTTEVLSDISRAWERVSTNIAIVAGADGGEERLRAAIISLGVSGRLMKGRSSSQDGQTVRANAIECLRRLMAEKKIRSRKLLPLPAEEDAPLPLPSHWSWARLDQLVSRIDYGTSQKAHEAEDGIPVIRMGNVRGGQVWLDSLKYVPRTTEGIEDLFLQSGDLLFNRTNSYELVGKMGIFKGAYDEYTFASYLIRVRPLDAYCLPEYLNFYFESSLCRITQIEPFITQQTNQANFNGSKLREVMVPVPPLDEQRQVVEKLEELINQLEELERAKASRRVRAEALSTVMLKTS